jgi:hypothetical protein
MEVYDSGYRYSSIRRGGGKYIDPGSEVESRYDITTNVYVKFYNEFEFADYNEYLSAFDQIRVSFSDNTYKTPIHTNFPQPLLIICEGGIEIRYQNNAVETFYIEDFLEIPNWLKKSIPFTQTDAWIPSVVLFRPRRISKYKVIYIA